MCGLVGMVFGEEERRAQDYTKLTRILSRLLTMSQHRGYHATGVAVMQNDGAYALLKAPLPARAFTNDPEYRALLSHVGNGTTAILGHVRYRTRGDETNNANNHPIVAGRIVGTHNGTITNADHLFEVFGMPRTGEVDSEVLFRIADSVIGKHGHVLPGHYLSDLTYCEGTMSAAMVATTAPKEVWLFRGNRPLAFRYSPTLHTLVYASEDAILDKALGTSGWLRLGVNDFTLLRVRTDSLPRCEMQAFRLADAPQQPQIFNAKNFQKFTQAG